MSSLGPTTLTHTEQRTILQVTAKNTRDHTIYSLALGTGLRLGEIVGLNVGYVFNGNGRRCVPAGQAGGEAEAVPSVQEGAAGVTGV